MARREFDLTDADAAFVEERLANGGYHDADEVVQAALTLLRCHDFGPEDPRELARVHLLLEPAFEDIETGRTIELRLDEVRPWLDAKLEAIIAEEKSAA